MEVPFFSFFKDNRLFCGYLKLISKIYREHERDIAFAFSKSRRFTIMIIITYVR